MKNLHKTNIIFTIILLLISLTIWGSIIALPLLGLTQIIMSILIFKNRQTLTNKNKTMFYSYIFLTLSLIVTYRLLYIFSIIEPFQLLFIWMFVSAGLALFHLYITYNIQSYHEL